MKLKLLLFNIYVGILFMCQAAGKETCVTIPGGNYNSCEMFTKRDGEGNLVPSSSILKNNSPLGSMLVCKTTNFSVTSKMINKNHPTGAQIFPKNGSLANLLNGFLHCFEIKTNAPWLEKITQRQDNSFLKYFTRIQLTSLYQIYQYLISIYTSLNLNHHNDLADYLSVGTIQALNKKTLIITYLLSIIETQLNMAVRARFPALAEKIASRVGPILMNHDYGANLDIFIKGQDKQLATEPNVQKFFQQQQELYTNIFSQYILLFYTFTHNIDQPDFIDLISIVEKELRGPFSKPLNPPLFFYTSETINLIKLIVKLADSMMPNTHSVAWPKKVVENAQSQAPIIDRYGNVISKYPRAFFLDIQERETTNLKNASALYVNIPMAENIYTQEVIKQPAWLNSKNGILAMLRVCLGDYSAAFSPEINDSRMLDAGLTYIILNSMNEVHLLKNPAILTKAAKDCKNYFQQYAAILSEKEAQMSSTPPVL